MVILFKSFYIYSIVHRHPAESGYLPINLINTRTKQAWIIFKPVTIG